MFASLRFACHGLLTFSSQAAVRNMVSQQTLISGIWTLLMSSRLSFLLHCQCAFLPLRASLVAPMQVRFLQCWASLRTIAIPFFDTRSCSWCSGWNWRLAVQSVTLSEEILHTARSLSPHRKYLVGGCLACFMPHCFRFRVLGKLTLDRKASKVTVRRVLLS